MATANWQTWNNGDYIGVVDYGPLTDTTNKAIAYRDFGSTDGTFWVKFRTPATGDCIDGIALRLDPTKLNGGGEFDDFLEVEINNSPNPLVRLFGLYSSLHGGSLFQTVTAPAYAWLNDHVYWIKATCSGSTIRGKLYDSDQTTLLKDLGDQTDPGPHTGTCFGLFSSRTTAGDRTEIVRFLDFYKE